MGKIARNVLQRNFTATKPTEKWVTDVTEFAVEGQKLYLSPIIVLFNGEVISHVMSERPVMKMVSTMHKALVRDKSGGYTNVTFGLGVAIPDATLAGATESTWSYA